MSNQEQGEGEEALADEIEAINSIYGEGTLVSYSSLYGGGSGSSHSHSHSHSRSHSHSHAHSHIAHDDDDDDDNNNKNNTEERHREDNKEEEEKQQQKIYILTLPPDLISPESENETSQSQSQSQSSQSQSISLLLQFPSSSSSSSSSSSRQKENHNKDNGEEEEEEEEKEKESYPSTNPPSILGIHSAGNHRSEAARTALRLLREAVGEVFVPGDVCLFDALERVRELFSTVSTGTGTGSSTDEKGGGSTILGRDVSEYDNEDDDNNNNNDDNAAEYGSRISGIVGVGSRDGNHEASSTSTSTYRNTHTKGGDHHHQHHHQNEEEETEISPNWTQSTPISELKSTFLARVATPVTSPRQARLYLQHLLATDKRVRSATHNITAWRIRGPNNTSFQDCDDDGETAAGSRLLHLMQLMDLWDAMVVVTRWYGGQKLGPRRFALINAAARDAFVKAGLVAEPGAPANSNTKKKGAGHGKSS